MDTAKRNPWLIKPKPRQHAAVKLLCFPYAGGGAAVYQSWAERLPDAVELNIVQLPGRGTHLMQSPIACMNTLIETLLSNITEIIKGRYVVFGHSLGSRIGFELVRRLVAAGQRGPLHFFASGSASPKRPSLCHGTADLPEQAFIDKLRVMNGTPPEVLANRELMQLLLPMLRADFRLAETYSFTDALTLPTGLTLLSGTRDDIAPEHLASWADFFTHSETVEFEGGHFFIDTHRQQVLDVVNARLQAIL